MPVYDLVCDACGGQVAAHDGCVRWSRDGGVESAFALVHDECGGGDGERAALAELVTPNGFLRFVTERFHHPIADAEALAEIVAALATFVVRLDDPAEYDRVRQPRRGTALDPVVIRAKGSAARGA